jgi:urease accessory protein
VTLALLHLCDSLFPLGGFAHSDGLETAASDGRVATADDLRRWMDACLDETLGRLEGPAVWQAWRAATDSDWHAVATLDEELTALRPSAAARAASRGMGTRLLSTWAALYDFGARPLPPPLLVHAALPIAFAAVCAVSDVAQRDAVAAYAYTRLAATTSAAMRLMPLGQTDAHALLARALERVPAIVDRIAARGGRIESFAPLLDIAAMSQQYVHSRLFRS